MRVIGDDGKPIGVLSLNDALAMARARQVDLVEIAANANPPVCRLVDFGKYRYEQAKKEKESKKHQHANKLKEVQLSANIDPHDFSVKLTHAIDFLCEDMKVKVTLRFRGREMAHQEFGFQKVQNFIKELTPFGHPDAPPKLIGKGINVMISPLPRAKRAKNPNQNPSVDHSDAEDEDEEVEKDAGNQPKGSKADSKKNRKQDQAPNNGGENNNFGNNAFAELELNKRQ